MGRIWHTFIRLVGAGYLSSPSLSSFSSKLFPSELSNFKYWCVCHVQTTYSTQNYSQNHRILFRLSGQFLGWQVSHLFLKIIQPSYISKIIQLTIHIDEQVYISSTTMPAQWLQENRDKRKFHILKWNRDPSCPERLRVWTFLVALYKYGSFGESSHALASVPLHGFLS